MPTFVVNLHVCMLRFVGARVCMWEVWQWSVGSEQRRWNANYCTHAANTKKELCFSSRLPVRLCLSWP